MSGKNGIEKMSVKIMKNWSMKNEAKFPEVFGKVEAPFDSGHLQ